VRLVVDWAICMANGGGGTVVFGVTDRVRGRRSTIKGVPPGIEIHRLKQAVYTQRLVILGRVQQRPHHRVLGSSEVLEEPLGSVDLPFGDLIHEAIEPLLGLGFHGVISVLPAELESHASTWGIQSGLVS